MLYLSRLRLPHVIVVPRAVVENLFEIAVIVLLKGGGKIMKSRSKKHIVSLRPFESEQLGRHGCGCLQQSHPVLDIRAETAYFVGMCTVSGRCNFGV